MNRWLTALYLCALVALAFASASGVEDYLGAHSFCAPGDGCELVRKSALGQMIGRVLPALGMLVYASIVLGGLSRSLRVRRAVLVLAIAGGLGGGVLLAIQGLVVGHFCWLCVGVDTAALATGVFALLAWRTGGLEQPPSPHAWAWAVGIAWALSGPLIWTLSSPAAMPEMVTREWKDGHINIVEWSDFNCPHCRKMHPILNELIDNSTQPVNLVRLNVPLSSKYSARAYRCAIEQDQGEAMAEMLFVAPEPSKSGCANLAAAMGLDLARYEACVENPATDAAIEADKLRVHEAGLEGLPTVWISGRKFVGFDEATSPARYAAAFKNAGTPPRHDFRGWVVLLLLSGLLAWTGRRRE